MTHKPPRVLLLGDSSRLAYQRRVADVLRADSLAVLFPEASTGRAACLDEELETYLDRFDPDIVCFAASPMAREELLLNDEAPDAQTLSLYRSQLQRVADRCIRRCGRQVVFVSLVPLDADRLARRGPAWARARASSLVNDLTTADRIGIDLMAQLNVMTVDMGRDVAPRADEVLAADGVGFSPEGAVLVGDAVARGIYAVM